MDLVRNELVYYLDANETSTSLAQCLVQAGYDHEGSEDVSECLVLASLRGTDSHGIRLFPHYYNSLRYGRISASPFFEAKVTSESSVLVDADHAFGQHVGRFALRHYSQNTKKRGACIYSIYNSSHPGAMAPISMPLAAKGYIILSFANADSLINVPGSTRSFFGTNPICCTGPAGGGEIFTIDSAMSQIPWNKVLSAREASARLDGNYCIDAQGEQTSDPAGAVMLSGIGLYKGHVLAAMVEILCGALAGGPVADQIQGMYSSPLTSKRRLSQTYIVIDPSLFSGHSIFEGIVQGMHQRVSSLDAKDAYSGPMMPGVKEQLCYAQRMKSGIPVLPDLYKSLAGIFDAHGIDIDSIAVYHDN